jgi:hypothetical protein
MAAFIFFELILAVSYSPPPTSMFLWPWCSSQLILEKTAGTLVLLIEVPALAYSCSGGSDGAAGADFQDSALTAELNLL